MAKAKTSKKSRKEVGWGGGHTMKAIEHLGQWIEGTDGE